MSTKMPRDHTKATQNAHRATHSVSIPCPTSLSRHREHTQNGSRDQLCGKPHNHRRHPSAPRASRALQGRGRQCTNAASRANPCKTAPASCRRPGTRTGRRQGRHPTPGSPALWTRAKQKRKFGQKGRLTKEKKKRGDFFLQEYFRRGNCFVKQF